MSLNHRQQRQLRGIETRLLRSDPRLAARLAVFGRLAVGQGMPVVEQLDNRVDRIRQAADLIVTAIGVMIAAIGVMCTAVLALFRAIVMGSKARPPQPARQRTGPGTTAGPTRPAGPDRS